MRIPNNLGTLISLLLVLLFVVAWRAGIITFTHPIWSNPPVSTENNPIAVQPEPLLAQASVAPVNVAEEPNEAGGEEGMADDSESYPRVEEKESPQEPLVAAQGATFFIYKDRGSQLNHYIPSGWMGDYGDLKFNMGWLRAADDTCIQVSYSADRKQGAGWAGIYWQHPANNWGDKRGGYDLRTCTRLRFSVRGDKGGEVVKFGVGGITGQTESGDTDQASLGPLTLTTDWETKTINLSGTDMSHIIGGFLIQFTATENPSGCVVYVDDIRFEPA